MSDLNPLVLAAILRESLGGWFWPLVVAGLLLLALVVRGGAKLARAGRSPLRPVLAGVVATLVAGGLAMPLVPRWTLAEFSALGGAVDYAAAFLLALAPGAAVGVVVFYVAASRCAARGRVLA
ncbi:DUF5368 family protein [Amaricoccus sp.]|uniref:DUF5368 family protein n=1 Tax=Amaricoccus sp. TaxID=1872485 RepID=UPI002613D34A|nr:DUF5368 family protein [Amaricoccus sp.]HRO12563.1 DUF5368 family protein [Amaricoccus sp.]